MRTRVKVDSDEGRTLPEFNRNPRVSLGSTIIWQKVPWAILDITETHVELGLLETACNHPCDEMYHEDCPNYYAFLEKGHAGEKDWQKIYGWKVP